MLKDVLQAGAFAFIFTSLDCGVETKLVKLDEAFLEALKDADPRHQAEMRVYRGGLLLRSSSRRLQAISQQPSPVKAGGVKRAGHKFVYAADDTRYGVRLGDLVETCLQRWNTFDPDLLWSALAYRGSDVTVVSHMSVELILAVDERLKRYPRYVGAVSPDWGNPLHRELFVNLLYKDAFIREGKVFGRRGADGELHLSFFGVQKFSGEPIRAIDHAAFESLAPRFEVEALLSLRGQMTEQRLQRLSKLDIHERVMQAVGYSSLMDKLPFDWDLSELPESPDEVTVQAKKITEYLLNPTGKGASKANFFLQRLDIGPESWRFLHAQLIDGLAALEVENVAIPDSHGIRFTARFPITGVNGKKKRRSRLPG